MKLLIFFNKKDIKVCNIIYSKRILKYISNYITKES
uniref:Uncharacterized protein n=1 Tax=Taenioma perpusillum TaxID=210852 RepID=A0A1Z1MRW4_9FLOR|nr:hypothetical protein [Taenioma perpusillum]ARW68454.1 hypothetical protein [Taenioma perpusillum]